MRAFIPLRLIFYFNSIPHFSQKFTTMAIIALLWSLFQLPLLWSFILFCVTYDFIRRYLKYTSWYAFSAFQSLFWAFIECILLSLLFYFISFITIRLLCNFQSFLSTTPYITFNTSCLQTGRSATFDNHWPVPILNPRSIWSKL